MARIGFRAVELDPAVRAYYERGNEADRLRGGHPSGPLEFARTQEIILRYLSGDSLDVLDVGGGPGIYAAWLAGLGHRVHLVDPVELHVEQALIAHPRITASVGDARALAEADDSFDAVLLLGPLYHLVEREERIATLAEAKRVLRPGGRLFAAAISRFAALFDLLVRLDRLHEPGLFELVESCVRTGVFKGSGENEVFTTAYFHLPAELRNEVEEAGFGDLGILQVEGPGFLVGDFEARWEDPQRREVLLSAARLVEDHPDLLAASSHLLAIAQA